MDDPSSSPARDRPEPPPSTRLFAALSASSFLVYLGASRAVREFVELASTLMRRLLEIAA